MDEEEDDDIYAPADVLNGAVPEPVAEKARTTKPDEAIEDLEDGEEEGEEVEEDESDSDIDIITERKDEPKSESTQTQRPAIVKPSPVRTSIIEQVRPSPSPAIKVDAPGKSAATPPRSGSSYPPARTSKLEVDARPMYEPNGKPITEIDMDADFPEDDKPWRRPGTDMTDYFNYGFDEFTWASYCLKQETLRKDVADSKKQLEEMQSFLGMPGGMPAMSGMPGATTGAMPAIGGSGDMPPEMAQMMQQMMASGMDPSQMSPDMFMQYMMQGAGGQAGMASYGQQGQGQQQMGYGYGAGAGGGGGGGGGGGRGRGQGRRNW